MVRITLNDAHSWLPQSSQPPSDCICLLLPGCLMADCATHGNCFSVAPLCQPTHPLLHHWAAHTNCLHSTAAVLPAGTTSNWYYRAAHGNCCDLKQILEPLGILAKSSVWVTAVVPTATALNWHWCRYSAVQHSGDTAHPRSRQIRWTTRLLMMRAPEAESMWQEGSNGCARSWVEGRMAVLSSHALGHAIAHPCAHSQLRVLARQGVVITLLLQIAFLLVSLPLCWQVCQEGVPAAAASPWLPPSASSSSGCCSSAWPPHATAVPERTLLFTVPEDQGA
jgi:hypothetical protein